MQKAELTDQVASTASTLLRAPWHTGGLGLVDGLFECRILALGNVYGRFVVVWSGTDGHKARACVGISAPGLTPWPVGRWGSQLGAPRRPWNPPDTPPRPQCLMLEATARDRAPGATGMGPTRVPASLSWGAILLGFESTLGAGWIRQSA